MKRKKMIPKKEDTKKGDADDKTEGKKLPGKNHKKGESNPFKKDEDKVVELKKEGHADDLK